MYFLPQEAWVAAFILITKKIEHTPSEGIILNEVRFRGSPKINFALCKVRNLRPPAMMLAVRATSKMARLLCFSSPRRRRRTFRNFSSWPQFLTRWSLRWLQCGGWSRLYDSERNWRIGNYVTNVKVSEACRPAKVLILGLTKLFQKLQFGIFY